MEDNKSVIGTLENQTIKTWMYDPGSDIPT